MASGRRLPRLGRLADLPSETHKALFALQDHDSDGGDEYLAALEALDSTTVRRLMREAPL